MYILDPVIHLFIHYLLIHQKAIKCYLRLDPYICSQVAPHLFLKEEGRDMQGLKKDGLIQSQNK